MKIKIMTMEAIKYVKENLDYVSIYYTQGKGPQIWLKEKLGKDAFVEVPDLEFNQCSLIISEEIIGDVKKLRNARKEEIIPFLAINKLRPWSSKQATYIEL